MYKIQDLKIVQVSGPNYRMTGLLTHPENVGVSLQAVVPENENGAIEITYQSFDQAGASAEPFIIDLDFIRPEKAEEAEIKYRGSKGSLHDGHGYIFD